MENKSQQKEPPKWANRTVEMEYTDLLAPNISHSIIEFRPPAGSEIEKLIEQICQRVSNL